MRLPRHLARNESKKLKVGINQVVGASKMETWKSIVNGISLFLVKLFVFFNSPPERCRFLWQTSEALQVKTFSTSTSNNCRRQNEFWMPIRSHSAPFIIASRKTKRRDFQSKLRLSTHPAALAVEFFLQRELLLDKQPAPSGYRKFHQPWHEPRQCQASADFFFFAYWLAWNFFCGSICETR